MRTFFHWRSVSVCVLVVGGAGCGAIGASADESPTSGPSNGSADTSGTGSGGSSSLGTNPTGSPIIADAAAIVAPEKEVEKAFEAPVATGHYVWAANPKTGRVALINSETFQVKTVAAGEGPTYIAAIPGAGDKAIVINVLSSDATYLSQGADGKLDQKTYALSKGSTANAWAVSPDGHYAIAWTDVSRVPKPDKKEGFQEIFIIDLTGPGSAVRQSVGFRPSSISFAADPPRAFAVTDDGISVVDLAMPNTPVKRIKYPLAPAAMVPPPEEADAANGNGGADAASPVEAGADVKVTPVAIAPGKADVSITPEGSFAIIRRDNSPNVDVVDLAKETSWTLKLSGWITDLDLADTGMSAVAVVRSASSVSVLPVPGTAQGTPGEIKIEGEIIGSVVIAPQGKIALLYTNAVPSSRLTVLNLDDHKYDVIDLHAPVLSVFPSPTAQHAIVIHDSQKGLLSGKPGAFSVVPLSGASSPVIRTTDAPPMTVSLSPKGDRAIIPARDTAQRIYLTYLAHLSSGIVDRYELASPPTAAGFVGEDGQAFIAQDHPEGRVTFIDPTSGQVRTITGFELGASVIEWSPRDGGSK
jgi:hypothetical protein